MRACLIGALLAAGCLDDPPRPACLVGGGLPLPISDGGLNIGTPRVAHLNCNDLDDLLLPNLVDGAAGIYVLLGRKHGFGVYDAYVDTAGVLPYAVTAVDLVGDGHADLLVYGANGGPNSGAYYYVSLLEATGPTTFKKPQLLQVGPYGNAPPAPARWFAEVGNLRGSADDLYLIVGNGAAMYVAQLKRSEFANLSAATLVHLEDLNMNVHGASLAFTTSSGGADEDLWRFGGTTAARYRNIDHNFVADPNLVQLKNPLPVAFGALTDLGDGPVLLATDTGKLSAIRLGSPLTAVSEMAMAPYNDMPEGFAAGDLDGEGATDVAFYDRPGVGPDTVDVRTVPSPQSGGDLRTLRVSRPGPGGHAASYDLAIGNFDGRRTLRLIGSDGTIKCYRLDGTGLVDCD